MRLDNDCFNGKSSVGVKYDRLEIDYELLNKRDFAGKMFEEDEEDYHPYSWDFVAKDGEDIFDRLGLMAFGGSGWVATLYRVAIGPALQATRNVYRSYFTGVF